MSDSPQPYRVLARKYRPQTFGELIGQDAMVQTLANAIRRGRLAHAFLMTGVRGVGKTSTARLIAKALNCVGPDGQGGPTIDPCGACEPCRAIAEGRHIDVIEMDAASHTGVDDVREIIEAVRYSSVSARYKVYIIDEVHMLSKNAFNALLKTLEEPPAHVKFLFATTEVNKVPVTVLSRCQRFDLRRISGEKLAAHFAHVTEAEGVQAEAEALALIARAAEGSARDGLSILDQAIAHAETGGGSEGTIVTAAQVREMLGLSDRGAIRRLFGMLLAGDSVGALDALSEHYALGVEPLSVLRGLLEVVHGVTMQKAGRHGEDPAQSAEEREALADWASQLGFAPLHRLWQLLLKGHDEVARAAMPMEAAEMALLRIIHAASLPDPSELARMLREGTPGAATGSATQTASHTASAPAAATIPATFEELVQFLDRHNQAHLSNDLHDCAALVKYAPPELVIRLTQPLRAEFCLELENALRSTTGIRWSVRGSDERGEPTLRERELACEAAAKAQILAAPIMAAALKTFPGINPDDDLRIDDTAKWSESA